MTAQFAFDNSFARDLEGFYARVAPTPVASPRIVKFNAALAEELGLDAAMLQSEIGAAIFSGNVPPPGADPIAMAYAGHQFGHFVPQLGDGRAILLGEVVDRDGMRRDIQLKGSGPTPFSRRGDGRAALGPVLREYLVSEAMHALGIPTTRALAAVTTGEKVYRETRPAGRRADPRGAEPHPRRHLPVLRGARATPTRSRGSPTTSSPGTIRISPTRGEPVARAARRRDRAPGRSWSRAGCMVGFIHGVMNTDNMAISGETIDYGPCAFMDAYDPATVFSSIDEMGRYAYANQPPIAQWNLARLAETLLPLIDADRETAIAIATERVGGLRRPVQVALAQRHARQARAVPRRRKATRRWCRTCWIRCRQAGRLHAHLPAARRTGCRGRAGAPARAVPGPGALRRLGGPLEGPPGA